MNSIPVAYSEVEVLPEEILKDIGYGNTAPESDVLDVINNIMELLRRKVKPRYFFAVLEGYFEGATISIGGQLLETGAVITRLLERSTSFAVFAATAGHEFEQILPPNKTSDDMLTAYLLDIAGTLLVEKVGDYMEKQLEALLPEMPHTNRFSPGYCGWHLTEQRKIFDLLGQNPCGIGLSDVCLMTPIKSISGIIGIGSNVQTGQYACCYCEMETCYKRKK
ncbi:MAG: hypothetical protein LBD59_03390 [Prevotellaceae bacterium]|jgi:hypothetical protein|nr:hypothetical protein [Prevotellaceae bacterium]